MRFLGCCMLLGAMVGAAVDAGAAHTATAARFAKAPVVDGKIAAGEWDRAVRTTGFQGIAGKAGMLEDRRGWSTVGFTDERLEEVPPKKSPPMEQVPARPELTPGLGSPGDASPDTEPRRQSDLRASTPHHSRGSRRLRLRRPWHASMLVCAGLR